MPTSSIEPNTATPEVHTTPTMTAALALRALPPGSNGLAGVMGALRSGVISRRESGFGGTSICSGSGFHRGRTMVKGTTATAATRAIASVT